MAAKKKKEKKRRKLLAYNFQKVGILFPQKPPASQWGRCTAVACRKGRFGKGRGGGEEGGGKNGEGRGRGREIRVSFKGMI